MFVTSALTAYAVPALNDGVPVQLAELMAGVVAVTVDDGTDVLPAAS